MALRTTNVAVCTSQRELALVMIEGGISPRCRFMAGRAIRTKLAVMFILLFMAGVTICRSAFEHAILMALLTGYVGMPSLKLEGELGMVNTDLVPARRRMA